MTTTTKDTVIQHIKEKVEFSIPTLQSELGLEYGEIRDIISELEEEKKIEFLEGIVYKWAVPDEKESEDDDKDDDENDDSDDSLKALFDRPFYKHPRHRPPSFLFDDSDEISDDESSSSEESDDSSDSDEDTSFNLMFKDSNDLSSFLEFLSKKAGELDSFIEGIGGEKKHLLLETKGGPLPNLDDDEISIYKFIEPYNYKRENIDLENNEFHGAVDMTIPDIDEPFHIFTEEKEEEDEEEEKLYFHDNGVVVKYIKHKAKDLNTTIKYEWLELIQKYSREICPSGSFVGDKYTLPIKKYDSYKNYNAALATFTTEVFNIISYVNTMLERNSTQSLFADLHNNSTNLHEEVAEKVISHFGSFTGLTDYLDKLVEICPEANSRTASRVALKAPIVAFKNRHPRRREITRFFSGMNGEKDSSLIIYFIIKKIKEIIKSDESGE